MTNLDKFLERTEKETIFLILHGNQRTFIPTRTLNKLAALAKEAKELFIDASIGQLRTTDAKEWLEKWNKEFGE